MRIVTPPTLEPVSLAFVKEQLGIGDDTLDSVLTSRITAARKWVENYCDRALLPQTIETRLDRFPAGNISLPWQDPISVVYVKYVDGAGVLQTMPPADYELDTYSAIGFIRPVYGGSWPATRDEQNAVRVQYTAGYGYTAVAEAKTVTSATSASPGVFSLSSHGYLDNDLVLMTAAAGMTEINGNIYPVYAKATGTFQLANPARTAGISTSAFGVFSAATAQKVTLNIEEGLIDALVNIIGHWTNYQQQIQNGGHMTKVPSAICRILDQYRTRFF